MQGPFLLTNKSNKALPKQLKSMCSPILERILNNQFDLRVIEEIENKRKAVQVKR